MDSQETPTADVAVAALVAATIKAVAEERWAALEEVKLWPVQRLENSLVRTIRYGCSARINDPALLAVFGVSASSLRAQDLWNHLLRATDLPAALHRAAGLIVNHGCLASRLLERAGREPSRHRLRDVYDDLAECLASGRPFLP